MTTVSEQVKAAAVWVSAEIEAETERSRTVATEAARVLHEGQAAGLAYGLQAAKLDPGTGKRAADLFGRLAFYRGTLAIRALEGYRVGHAVALAVVEYARSLDAQGGAE